VAQNIYDDAGFFDGYSQLPRSMHGLDGAAEWDSLRSMVPDLSGARVVDLGCGFGWFCRWAVEAGASSVLGLDLSENMLARAKADTDHPRVRYERHDLERLELPSGGFDFAYSSLTLHYLVDLAGAFGVLHRSLLSGAAFVFSVEHPLFTAPSSPAFVEGPTGTQVWPLDRYLDEGPRITNWLAQGVVKQHRTIGTYVGLLVDAGFAVEQLLEWGPSAEQVVAVPEWAVERERPPFLLVRARRL
jgi:SAM-dependent methyltransferase